jgi:hypothetical protein
MVDCNILLTNLQHYGIGGLAHRWLESYLINREQFFSVGPLVFVKYIDDLSQISELERFVL